MFYTYRHALGQIGVYSRFYIIPFIIVLQHHALVAVISTGNIIPDTTATTTDGEVYIIIVSIVVEGFLLPVRIIIDSCIRHLL